MTEITFKPLDADRLYTPCDTGSFRFETTAELDDLDTVVGQDRAIEAVKFAIGIRRKGYNVFALGPEGSGKYSLVRRFAEDAARDQPVPDDWAYVYNFEESHKPRALRLPPGRARPLADDMEQLVEDLRQAIPAAFESDEYRNRRQVVEEQFKERHEEEFGALQKKAEKKDVALIRTPMGLGVAPTREGEVISPDEFKELPEDERKRREEAMEEIQKELGEILARVPRWEKEQREQVRELNREITQYAVGHLIEELSKRYEDLPKVVEHLRHVEADVVEHADDFLPQGEQQQQQQQLQALMGGQGGQGGQGRRPEGWPFRRYHVNVIVDHCNPEGEEGVDRCAEDDPEKRIGAPVVYEDHPIHSNLIGRIEHMPQYGALVTDFKMIKPGSLHQANGGYLVLDARKLVTQPFAYDALKRALRFERIRIESPGEAYGLISTVTLEPEPIPLDVVVVLLGDPMLYYLLNHYDPEFGELFKVSADFDTRMDRTPDAADQYARLIGTLARKDGLRPLDPGGVGRVVEHGARIASDSEKLTTHMASVVDLVREADYWAREAGSDVVRREHVQKAIDAKVYRSDRLRERIQEEIARGTLLVETEGARVGQINGLAVMQLDHFAFGKPSRISARVRLGRGEVVDIEREVDLGGPLHSKGVMILSSYLGHKFAEDRPLSLSASLVFEQSYSGVDGDSASSTELYALLSALADVPIRQSLAVTGSVDQNGRVQAIGGVNEKIEGFFDVCRARGLNGEHGVLIPATNVKHLMLREDVVEAARDGRFHIYPVETIDQGIEILTGVPAGERQADGTYPIGSINRKVAVRLEHFARRARESHDGRGRGGAGRNGPGRDGGEP